MAPLGRSGGQHSSNRAIILTLALGIGANSAVFSAIDAILLRPLPYPEGDRLMELQQINQKVQQPQTRLAPLRLEDWNRLNSTFEAITGYYTEDDSETSGTLPEKIKVAYVAPRFFQVFGVAPVFGASLILLKNSSAVRGRFSSATTRAHAHGADRDGCRLAQQDQRDRAGALGL